MRRIGAFAAFLLLGAAACTSADGSGPTSTPPLTTPSTSVSIVPPTSSSSTPTPPPSIPPDVPRSGPNTKPGETPPVLPVVGTQHTADGAKAFAEFFIRTIDWGYATTSSAYMRRYFEKSCVACVSAADSIDRARRRNHHFVGDRFTIRKAQLLGADVSPATVTVTFDVTSGEVVDADNKFVNGEPAIPGFEERITAAWKGSGWVVHEMVPHK